MPVERSAHTTAVMVAVALAASGVVALDGCGQSGKGAARDAQADGARGGAGGASGPMRGGTPPVGVGGAAGESDAGGGGAGVDARAGLDARDGAVPGDRPNVDAPAMPDHAPDRAAPADMPPAPGDGGALPPGSTSCAADGDCIMATYNRPVMSQADCYCPGCPSTALNRMVADRWAADWKLHCDDWYRRANCPVPACVMPEPPRCTNGMCRAAGMAPATCPGSLLCPGGGIRCGAGCCKAGEWCDGSDTCRCGSGPGCTGADECGTFGPVTSNQCGSVCCGPTAGRLCPR